MDALNFEWQRVGDVLQRDWWIGEAALGIDAEIPNGSHSAIVNTFTFTASHIPREELVDRVRNAWQATLFNNPHLCASIRRIPRPSLDGAPYPCFVLQADGQDVVKRAQGSFSVKDVPPKANSLESFITENSNRATSRAHQFPTLTLLFSPDGSTHAFMISIAHVYIDATGLLILADQLLQHIVNATHLDPAAIDWSSKISTTALQPAMMARVRPDLQSDATDIKTYYGKVVERLKSSAVSPMLYPDQPGVATDGSTELVKRELDFQASTALRARCRELGVTVTVAFDAAIRFALALHSRKVGKLEGKPWSEVVVSNDSCVLDGRRFLDANFAKQYTALAAIVYGARISMAPLDGQYPEDCIRAGVQEVKKSYDYTLKQNPAAYIRGLSNFWFDTPLWKTGFQPYNNDPRAFMMSSVGVVETYIRRAFRSDTATSSITLDDYRLHTRSLVGGRAMFHLYSMGGRTVLQFGRTPCYSRELIDGVMDEVMKLIAAL